MAIFNSGGGQTNLSSATTIIAHGTTLKGDIQLACNLHIDGEVEGSIQTTGNLIVGKTGSVNGEVRACGVSISGRFDGAIDAENVEILEGGKLFGKITAKALVIEPSAVFEGESKLKSEEGEPAFGLGRQDARLTAV